MRVLIDGNSLCHKAKHAVGELTTESMNTGVVFGFLNQILKLATAYNTNDLVFAWDSKKSHRIKLFPAYKEKRRTQKENKTPEELEFDKACYQQFDLLADEIIPSLGFKNSFKFSGFEGDDIIASVVYDNPDDDFVIATGDEDMYQLLGDGVSIRKSRTDFRGKKTYYLYTEQMFTEEYGITPKDWIEVKALAGCKGDEVPGIKGTGEDTAIKYLKGELTPNMKRYQNIVCPEGRAVRSRNLQLVSLPFKGCPEIVLQKQGPLSFNYFNSLCIKYEFDYYLRKENLDKWKKYLNLR